MLDPTEPTHEDLFGILGSLGFWKRWKVGDFKTAGKVETPPKTIVTSVGPWT